MTDAEAYATTWDAVGRERVIAALRRSPSTAGGLRFHCFPKGPLARAAALRALLSGMQADGLIASAARRHPNGRVLTLFRLAPRPGAEDTGAMPGEPPVPAGARRTAPPGGEAGARTRRGGPVYV